MKNKNNKNENSYSMFLPMFFVMIIVGAMLFFYSDIPYISKSYYEDAKKENENIDKEKISLFETPYIKETYFKPITIKCISQDDNSVTVKAGARGLKEYVVPADNEFTKGENDRYAKKTNDTYVRIENTNYYLYAYINEGVLMIGIAK